MSTDKSPTSGAAAAPRDEIQATPRTTLKRAAARGCYDRGAVNSILDEALVCHVAFARDGQPFVVPMIYARHENDLYLHGSTGNRTLRALVAGAQACVTVTLLDGLVMARSAFHHSVNYRSVVLYGVAEQVIDEDAKVQAMRALIEHVARGRWDEVRPPSREEMLRTMIVRLPISEASAKLRTGPPLDDEEDYALPVWAGVIPLHLDAEPAQDDPRLRDGVALPDYLRNYDRRARG